MSRSAPQARSVDAVLRELGPRVRSADRLVAPSSDPSHRFATGVRALDALLTGGLPRGGVGEISAPPSAGRTSLAWSLLARLTRAGELVAWVDPADAFDPRSAREAGVVLEQLLWIRPRDLDQALRSTERVLEARGFALVVLDVPAPSAWRAPTLPRAAAPRLQRAAAASGTTLLALSPERLLGSHAGIALTLRSEDVHFTGTPPWLESHTTRAFLVRNRTGPPDGSACLHLRTPGGG